MSEKLLLNLYPQISITYCAHLLFIHVASYHRRMPSNKNCYALSNVLNTSLGTWTKLSTNILKLMLTRQRMTKPNR